MLAFPELRSIFRQAARRKGVSPGAKLLGTLLWRSWLKLNIVTLAILIVAAILFGTHVSKLPWTPWRITGLAIAAPSLLLLVVARIQLGRAFSIQAKASSLVTSGLYSRIRNPIYVFGSLMILGVIVFAGQPWWILILVALVPLQIHRSRKEAQVLEKRFGTAYLEYKRTTWF
jgi:protein-S-isoprenylcysteine O-methyltransferase Ste14